MQTTASPGLEARCQVAPSAELERLQHVIDHAAHLLPAQGPITVFIHHNTLHAFEDLPFHEAVKKGAQVFGCHPYLSEDRYRDELRRGRIRFSELQEVVEQDLGPRVAERIPCFGTPRDLRLAMLQYPLRIAPTHELVWYVAQESALRRVRSEASSAVRARMIAETRRWVMRDVRAAAGPTLEGIPPQRLQHPVPTSVVELLNRFGESTIEHWSDEDWEGFTLQALWRLCCDGVRDLPVYSPPHPMPLRHRDLLLQATGEDADGPVHDLLVRFCAAFLDQGLAHWPLPGRDAGFLRVFSALYRQPLGTPERWIRLLPEELARLDDPLTTPLDSIHASLEILGVGQEEWEPFLAATLLALRGWAGMVRQIEARGDRVVHPIPPGSLTEFLAVRLLLDRLSLAETARHALGYTGPLSGLRELLVLKNAAPWRPSVEQRAFPVFQLAQILGLSPDVLSRLRRAEWSAIVGEIETFTAHERRRVFHLAYERRFNTQTLDAIALHARHPVRPPSPPRFQAVFCIDEREESIRRHLEELAPDAETLSTAGFFSIAMYYRGAADAHFVPLCPAVMQPRHWVAEGVVATQEGIHQRGAKARRTIGLATHQFHIGSRSFAVGALLAAAVGVLASVPLIARTLFPRLTARVRRAFGGMVLAAPVTRLQLERAAPDPGPENGALGFTLEEMTAIAEKVLRELGQTAGIARVVLVLGHGSTSMNNPHESAHDCGACGGARGGPNARALAQILNDGRVRVALGNCGIAVPTDTLFVGGMHNTSSETVTFYDLDLVPPSRQGEFEAVRAIVELAADRDAHERCRRFWSAALTLPFPGARQHVEGRAEDLAQVRPEWGHATNAICIVGRRDFTRGLFLDRRAFLTSYDPTQDDAEHSVLMRILGAVFPVCAGINLEYYFSYVDNTGFGCGTKLPHNIASLVGVMDGAASDLRTGLPWQMVEIHEPVRLQMIIETTAEVMLDLMARSEVIGGLCRNEWVHLALMHPQTRTMSVFRDGSFEEYRPQASVLPQAASSVAWYRGWRDHLEFAEIGR
jgi:uncharacterized protein YbcC (UPF0753/DUF2309 family)